MSELQSAGTKPTSGHLLAAESLFELARKINLTAPIDTAPAAPSGGSQVYLGDKFVNNVTLSDVTFLVEGREFYAHRIALLASSDIFRWAQQKVPAMVCLVSISCHNTPYTLTPDYAEAPQCYPCRSALPTIRHFPA